MILKNLFSFVLIFLCNAAILVAQEVQPASGPGGADYIHADVKQYDLADNPDGYWLFEPVSPKPDSAHVVVFMHGYGAYNPMIYGEWIEHIVRKGNIVIYPRYQKNLLSPKPEVFSTNAATAICDALNELQIAGHVKPKNNSLSLVGHSYGGVISADLAANYEKFEIPKPSSALLCSPGTGWLKGGRLDDYSNIPSDTKLLIMVSDNDHIVGDEFAKLVFSTAVNTPNRNFIRQFADRNGKSWIGAGHNESYSVYQPFDSGIKNVTSKRAVRTSRTNAVDYFGYWKLFDALLACDRAGNWCEFAFGDTEEQRFLGIWPDGSPIRPLEVNVPVNSVNKSVNIKSE